MELKTDTLEVAKLAIALEIALVGKPNISSDENFKAVLAKFVEAYKKIDEFV